MKKTVDRCHWLVPVYIGERGIATRATGEAASHSPDYILECVSNMMKKEPYETIYTLERALECCKNCPNFVSQRWLNKIAKESNKRIQGQRNSV